MRRYGFSPFRRFRMDRRGSLTIMAGMGMVALLGVAAAAIDVGNVVVAQRHLQASTDAAALAGARIIGSNGDPIAVALSYGSATGQRNAQSNLGAKMATGYPQLKCFRSTGVTCTGSPSANGIVVKQQASVPTYFAKVLGIDSVTITTTSTAGARGGQSKPVDVFVVLDTTQSMNSSDSSCSISHATRLDCALAGLRALLTGFWPTVDQVGIMVFPGLKNTSQQQYEYDCSSSPAPQIVNYKTSPTPPTYKVLGLVADYRTSNTASALNTASNIVKAARGGTAGCGQGIAAIGGVGTFYADAITAAQTELATNGRANVQKAIVLLGDGDANASSTDMDTAKKTNQCHLAITAAHTAATAGTWVYSIAYGASTSSSSSCGSDSPRISACDTMRQIASDASKFFSDQVGGTNSCTAAANPVSDLINIFQNIGTDLTSARLLPDNAT